MEEDTKFARAPMRSFSGHFRHVTSALACALTLASGSAGALTPPEPFVRDYDGVTKLSLEEAGILNPDNPDARRDAIALGKALFWDLQAGSDGNACASCHFHAGADTRIKNQLTPGFNDITVGPSGDTEFGSERSDTGAVAPGRMPSGANADSNYTLKRADLPLHVLEDETNRNSRIVTTTNDRISSQGAFAAMLNAVRPDGASDDCTEADGSIFHAGKFPARQVEPRNTPTTINAAFNHRNFWDGRATNLFNGVGVFGMRDIEGDWNKRLIVLDQWGQPQLGYVKIENASLASQAVGPPLSEFEMSCSERKFADVGRKLLFTTPLRTQKVHAKDSVLGWYRSPSGKGLKLEHSYGALVMRAFNRKYWDAPGRYEIVDGKLRKIAGGYAQMEINFPLFWGVAMMLYEQTLISDWSEFDDLQSKGKLAASPAFNPVNPGCTASADVDPLLLRGCQIFMRFAPGGANGPVQGDGIRGGSCFVCHNKSGGGAGPNPPMLSQASFQEGQPFALMIRVGSVVLQSPGPPPSFKNHTHDQGFMSIGLRPVFTDLINGANDPYGNPFSYSRQFWRHAKGTHPDPVVDPELQREIDTVPSVSPTNDFTLLGVDSASKTPILRNVALTPPYFSWGGYPSLRQAMKLYNRGANRRDINAGNATVERAPYTTCTRGDNTGSGPEGNTPYEDMDTVTDCASNTTGLITPLGLADCEAPAGSLPKAACDARGLTVYNDDLAALERFLKSLTDPAVQCDKAPFDHPQLKIIKGHKTTDGNGDGLADDMLFTLPEVGASGYATSSGFCIPNAGDLFATGMQSRSGGAKLKW